jgi:CP family cyanate transporter-like MFS transporter
VIVGAAIVLGLAGMVGLLVAPSAAPYLWVVLLALGPLTFPLSLTLIGVRTSTPLSALVLSGYVNKIGYLLSAAGPLVAGYLLQLTGGWTASVIFLMVVILAEVPAIWVLGRDRSVDDELAEKGAAAHLSK